MEYKGYVAQIEFDESGNVLHGRVVGVQAVISFEAQDGDAIRGAFEEAIDHYIDWCGKRGKVPEKPFSGNIMVRGTADDHRAAAAAAAAESKSLNQWVLDAIRSAVGVRAANATAVPAEQKAKTVTARVSGAKGGRPRKQRKDASSAPAA